MIRNLRDLGGIINCHGEVIPCRMFYRSANLSDATPDDLTGISEVIDLRTATGRERAPDQIPEHITYHAIPIVDEATAGITQDASLDSIPDMVSLYRKMVISCQSAIQSVLSIVFSHDYSSGGVLWHCTAGKDRSGLITAYVLAALGVTREEIMKDYMLSNLIGKFPSTALEVIIGHDAVLFHKHMNRLACVVLLATLVYVAIWYFHRRKKEKEDENPIS